MNAVRTIVAVAALSLAALSVCAAALPAAAWQQSNVKHIPDPDRELHALLEQGQAALDRKDFQAAADDFRKYIAKKPDDAYAHFQLGYACTALGLAAEARDEYGRAATLDPKMAPAQLNYGLAVLEENPAAAIAPLRRAAELLPQEVRPQFVLGWALERAGQPAAAIEQYRRAEALGADDFDVHFALARTLLVSNQPPEAEAEFRRALAIQPQSAPAHLGLGESLVAQKNSKAAAAELTIYLHAKPQDAATRVQLASVLADSGKDEDALAELDRAGDASAAGTLDALELRGEILIRLKKYPQAAATLEKAAALAPQDASLHARLGRAWLEAKDYPHAAPQLVEALRLDPQQMDALRDLVAVQYRAGNYPAALSALDLLAKREEPTDAIWFIRAECYDKLQKKPEALQAYQKFLALHVGTNDDRYFAATDRVRRLSREVKH